MINPHQQSLFGLHEKTLMEINKILSEYPAVNEAIIFGSRAKGNFTPSSDIDLALKGDKINLKTLNEISLRLDDLLLPVLFDIVIYDHINNQDLIDHIDRVGKAVYKYSI